MWVCWLRAINHLHRWIKGSTSVQSVSGLFLQTKHDRANKSNQTNTPQKADLSRYGQKPAQVSSSHGPFRQLGSRTFSGDRLDKAEWKRREMTRDNEAAEEKDLRRHGEKFTSIYHTVQEERSCLSNKIWVPCTSLRHPGWAYIYTILYCRYKTRLSYTFTVTYIYVYNVCVRIVSSCYGTWASRFIRFTVFLISEILSKQEIWISNSI